jgi:hypothetical protein
MLRKPFSAALLGLILYAAPSISAAAVSGIVQVACDNKSVTGAGNVTEIGNNQFECSYYDSTTGSTANVFLNSDGSSFTPSSPQNNVQTQGQKSFVPLAKYDNSQVLQGVVKAGNLPEYLNRLFQVSLSVGAILAVIMLVYGGYLYMGSEMWTSKQKARQVITDAVIGLLFCSVFTSSSSKSILKY